MLALIPVMAGCGELIGAGDFVFDDSVLVCETEFTAPPDGELTLSNSDVFGLGAESTFSSICGTQQATLRTCTPETLITLTEGESVLAGGGVTPGGPDRVDLTLRGSNISLLFVLVDVTELPGTVTLDAINAAATITTIGSEELTVLGDAAAVIIGASGDVKAGVATPFLEVGTDGAISFIGAMPPNTMTMGQTGTLPTPPCQQGPAN